MYPSKTNIVAFVNCPGFIKDNILKGGIVTPKASGGPQFWAGGFSMVFQISQQNELWAFKVWHTYLENIKERYEKIHKHLNQSALPYFSEFSYVEDGLWVEECFIDTYRMRWIEGWTLNEYISNNLTNPQKLLLIAGKFLEMVKAFHLHGIAHGDLQHGNILVKKDGNLVVVDYDSMFVKELVGFPDIVKGQAGYQHPKRQDNIIVHEKLDYFSELIIYLSLIVYAERPEYWDDGTDWFLFSKEDFAEPKSCELLIQLAKSNNPLIAHLIENLQKFLLCEDIKELKPLEEIVTSQLSIVSPLIKNITDLF